MPAYLDKETAWWPHLGPGLYNHGNEGASQLITNAKPK